MTVHPRSRGEHLRRLLLAGGHLGSSPLARGTRGSSATGRRSPPVHPRSRGEHRCFDARGNEDIGSSPLARGTRGSSATGRRSPPVHPRSRGEHRCFDARGNEDIGSSPLARGTRGARGPFEDPGRFIPARAGNTAAAGRCRPRWTVHPRSRGEHWTGGAWSGPSFGSSPLARGTPPCARARRDPRTVHPRSRGEHDDGPPTANAAAGSSPLARGTQRLRTGEARRHRFIPARAGNTAPSAGALRACAVHPRSRGEHGEPGRFQRHRAGSSPLARGTPEHGGARRRDVRFIPARAGNTRFACATVTSRIGSSPLARGTPVVDPPKPERLRFIPARAGNTRFGAVRMEGDSVHPRSRGEHSTC